MGYKPKEMEEALQYIKELEAESKDWETAFKEERQERVGLRDECEQLKITIIKHTEENKELKEGNKKRFDKIKGLEYQLKQEKEKKPDQPIVIKDSDIKRANKNLSKQLETEKDRVNQVLTALECCKEENKELKEKNQEGVDIMIGVKQSMEEMFDKIKELEQENEKLTKKIQGVTICLTSVAECLNQ